MVLTAVPVMVKVAVTVLSFTTATLLTLTPLLIPGYHHASGPCEVGTGKGYGKTRATRVRRGTNGTQRRTYDSEGRR